MPTEYIESLAWENDDTSNLAALYYDYRWLAGPSIQSGSSWAGKGMVEFSAKLGITGSPQGTITCQVFSDDSGSPGTPIATSTNSHELGALYDGSTVTFEFDQITLSAGNIIAIYITESGTDSSNYVNFKGKTGQEGYDSNIKQDQYPEGATALNWETSRTHTANCRLGYTEIVDTTTLLPPPIAWVNI